MNLSFARVLSRSDDRPSRQPTARPFVRAGAPLLDGQRLGLSRVKRPLPSAALRVLETTWRLWREHRPA